MMSQVGCRDACAGIILKMDLINIWKNVQSEFISIFNKEIRNILRNIYLKNNLFNKKK